MVSASQDRKAFSPIVATVTGIKIEVKAAQLENPNIPISVSASERSTLERDEQFEKANMPSVVTFSSTLSRVDNFEQPMNE